MLLITKEQADKRLSSENNVANLINKDTGQLTIVPIKKGGGSKAGATHLSEEQRILIGTLANQDRVKTVAQTFSLSESHVKNLKHGRVDRAGLEHKTHEELKAAVEGKSLEARDVALDKLMVAMGLIDTDKLEGVSAKDLSVISSNMSRVYQNTYAQQMADGQKINIVVYSPEMKKVNDYKVVEL